MMIDFKLIDDSEELNLQLLDDNEEIKLEMTDYDDTEVKEMIDEVDNKVDNLSAQVNHDINDIETDIDELDGRVRINTNNISNLQQTKADKTQVNELSTQVQANTTQIGQNKANITALSNRVDQIPVVTKTSQLTNDSGFITKDVNNLTYYTKTANLSRVALTGNYNDLTNKPDLSNFATTTELGNETTARENADIGLQGQIDAITSSSDVKDIVGTYTELQNYDTSTLGNDDIIKVLQDSTHNEAMTYYRWVISGSSGSWQYIGQEGPYYTKSESDTLLNAKQNEITSSNKLNSDLVSDSNSGNKFVTSSQKTSWNAKYDKPNGGIPKTDLASDIQTSLGKADSALQSITSSDVTSALGYTPYDSANPAGYTSNTGTITSVKMNGTTVASSGEADLGTVITEHQSLDGCVQKDGGSATQTISLSSGTGTTALGVKSRSTSSYISFTGANAWLGSIGVTSDKKPTFYNGASYMLAYTSDIPKVFYGTSATGASTAAKVVVCEEFTESDLVTGARLVVHFTNGNSYNGQATLNVNSTGAKNIYYNGTSTNARYMWVTGESVEFIYNGEQWATINGGLATTTYYGVTKLATGANSDSQAYALTPRSLYYFANYSIAPYYSTSKTYAVGDKVRYSYYIYECITAIDTPESWNAEHWQQTDTIQEQIDILKDSIPSEVTETTVSNWGFTKNTGTITGITMNGTSKGTSGVVDLGTVITSHQDISGKLDVSKVKNTMSTTAGDVYDVRYINTMLGDIETLLSEV